MSSPTRSVAVRMTCLQARSPLRSEHPYGFTYIKTIAFRTLITFLYLIHARLFHLPLSQLCPLSASVPLVFNYSLFQLVFICVRSSSTFITATQARSFSLLVSSSSGISTLPNSAILSLLRYLKHVLTFRLKSLGKILYVSRYVPHVNKLVLHAHVDDRQFRVFVWFHQLTFGINLFVPDMYLHSFLYLLF